MEADSLLASARKAPPIPVRKAILKADVAAKKPAAKGFKKPAAGGTGSKKANGISDSFKVEGQKLTLMHYKATGSWAVRIVGGKQLLQVKSKKGSQESKKWAEHLKKKLEEGWDLGKARQRLGRHSNLPKLSLLNGNVLDSMCWANKALEKLCEEKSMNLLHRYGLESLLTTHGLESLITVGVMGWKAFSLGLESLFTVGVMGWKAFSL